MDKTKTENKLNIFLLPEQKEIEKLESILEKFETKDLNKQEEKQKAKVQKLLENSKIKELGKLIKELQRRAKSNELIITEPEENELRGRLGEYMRLKNDYIGENGKFYPDEILLAARQLSDYGIGSNNEKIINAANLFADFFKNPSGIIQVEYYKDMQEAEKECERMLESLSNACRNAFSITRNNVAEYAADELLSLVSLFKYGNSIEIVIHYLDRGMKKLTDAARDWAKFGYKNGLPPKSKYEITQKVAAELCGKTIQTIRNWERGISTPRGFPKRINLERFMLWANDYRYNERIKEKIHKASYNENDLSHNNH